jgi:hypothetical protein
MKNIFLNLLKSKSASGLIFCLLILFVTNTACLLGGQKSVDKNIVGVWEHQEMLGDPRTGSMVIVRRMQLNEDRTAYFADGDEVTQGKWYVTHGGLYFVYENGDEVYAGSYEYNDEALLIYTNDGKKLWKRI